MKYFNINHKTNAIDTAFQVVAVGLTPWGTEAISGKTSVKCLVGTAYIACVLPTSPLIHVYQPVHIQIAIPALFVGGLPWASQNLLFPCVWQVRGVWGVVSSRDSRWAMTAGCEVQIPLFSYSLTMIINFPMWLSSCCSLWYLTA